jgi:hypothetical protein
LTYPLKMVIWKRPGNVNASNVQHVAPTKAMMLVKLGIINTINPVSNTIDILNTFWNIVFKYILLQLIWKPERYNFHINLTAIKKYIIKFSYLLFMLIIGLISVIKSPFLDNLPKNYQCLHKWLTSYLKCFQKQR